MHISAGIGAANRPGPGRPRLKGQRPPAPSGLPYRAYFGGRRPRSRERFTGLDRARVANELSILARPFANRPKCRAYRSPPRRTPGAAGGWIRRLTKPSRFATTSAGIWPFGGASL